MMAPKIERLSFDSSHLGEGPHWDVERQTLYFVDILGFSLVRYTPGTKKYARASLAPKRPSFIIPVADKKDQFVISLNNDIAIITWDGESDKVTIDEILYTASESDKITFNDGKCDPTGRLWAGTLEFGIESIDKIQPIGNLYSLDSKRQTKPQVGQIRVSNGLTFNAKANKFYYIDSGTGAVDRFDFDAATGTVANREVLFTLNKHNVTGVADGMTIDSDGNLWVAVFGGNRVLKIDGTKPETLLLTIELPAKQVTSVIWGGKNLDELYVVTGRMEQEGVKLPAPENGSVYKITNTGTKGLPGVNYKLN